jgi:hypothetical protein
MASAVRSEDAQALKHVRRFGDAGEANALCLQRRDAFLVHCLIASAPSAPVACALEHCFRRENAAGSGLGSQVSSPRQQSDAAIF